MSTPLDINITPFVACTSTWSRFVAWFFGE